jgi:hypothetical protein
MKRAMVLAIAVLVLGALLLPAANAFAQRDGGGAVGGTTGQFQYVIKFLCGQLFRDPFDNPSGQLDGAPGQYYTDINVHNPNSTVVRSHKKFAFDGRVAQLHGPVTSPELFILDPDQALQITCADIRRFVPYPFLLEDEGVTGQFIKGFVVILTRQRLDVTAIYTVCPPQTTTGSLQLGCPLLVNSSNAAGSVSSIDVVYLSEQCPLIKQPGSYYPQTCGLSQVAAPARLLPAVVATSQSASGELKIDINARSMIAYESARLLVYDQSGRQLHDSGFTTSTQLRFKPLAASGREFANGVYLYVIEARDVFGRVGYHVGKVAILR